jgi:pimeloyl-ACP methyl ester carboxylesterase
MPNPPAPKAQRIAIDRSGAGPAIVLTHGLGDSAETWSGLRPHLDGFETWAWDMLGHGQSAKPTEKSAYSMQGVLDDLEDVIDRVGRDVVLVGHSLGGYLSQHRAVRDLSSIRGLVLIATGPGYRDPIRREKWNGLVRKTAARFEGPAAAAQMAEQHDELVMANLERLTLPVLQIIGERDTQYHGAFEVLKKRVPGVESLRVPDAGHHVHNSHAEHVGPVVKSFLERLP